MSALSGKENLQLNQERLLAITRNQGNIISVAEAAAILNMPTRAVAKLMARWVEARSISRIKRGLYLASPSGVVDISPIHPWVIAENLFRPCYIGGLTAAAHWGLIDCKHQTNMILTAQKPRKRCQSINGIHFLLRSISKEAMFGLIPICKEQCNVQISNPARTMLDFFIDPRLGGGIYNVTDMFIKYLKSDHKNLDSLFEYAKRIGSGAVLKRFGFLLEQYQSCELNIIAFCKLLMTTGNIKLDPKLNADQLVTRWGLWVPKEW